MDAGSSFRGSRSHEVNVCARSDGSRPPHIEIGFSLGGVYAWIFSVEDYVRAGEILRQPEHGAEIDDVLHVDIAFTDDGDALAGAIDFWRAVKQRRGVVNGGKGRGPDGIAVSVETTGKGEQRLCFAGLRGFLEGAERVEMRGHWKIVQRNYAGNRAAESEWNLWIGGICEMSFDRGLRTGESRCERYCERMRRCRRTPPRCGRGLL